MQTEKDIKSEFGETMIKVIGLKWSLQEGNQIFVKWPVGRMSLINGCILVLPFMEFQIS